MKRAYTPISAFNQEGYFDLLFKVYTANEEYPAGGEVSRFLNELKEGDKVSFNGPVGKFIYVGDGQFLRKC